jgi:hypothetical protein
MTQLSALDIKQNFISSNFATYWSKLDALLPQETFLGSRTPSSRMLRRVALVRTEVPEERDAFIIRVTIIGELGTTLAVTSNQRKLRRNIYTRFLVMANVVSSSPILVTLMMEALSSSERLFLQEPHCSITHKTAFFIVADMRTSPLT